MRVNISIPNANKLLAAFQAAPQVVERQMYLATRAASRDIAQEARSNHRFISRLGNVERAIKEKPVTQANGVTTGVVYLDPGEAAHAKYLYKGTGLYGQRRQKYYIRPVNKQALRWVGNNRFVFARRVHHPGIKPDPFIHNAARNLAQHTNEVFARYANRAFRITFGGGS